MAALLFPEEATQLAASEYANEVVGADPPHDGPGTELTDAQLDENAEFWRRWDEAYEYALREGGRS